MRVRVRASVREKRKRRLPSSLSLVLFGLLILGLCKQVSILIIRADKVLVKWFEKEGNTIDKRQLQRCGPGVS